MTTNQKIQLGQLSFSREMAFDKPSEPNDKRTVTLAFASSAQIDRGWYIETIDMKGLRLDRLLNGAALLLNHSSDKQIGVVERAWVDADNIARAEVRFSTSAFAEEIYQDVLSGIRRLVSFGYTVNSYTESEINKREYILITDCEATEISIVSVPADTNVGVGRSVEAPAQNNTNSSTTLILSSQPQQKERTMATENTPDHTNAINAERTRAEEILAIGKNFKIEDQAREALSKGTPLADFRAMALGILEKRQAEGPQTIISSDSFLTQKEQNRYSVARAVSALTDMDWAKAGFEREVSAHLEKTSGKTARGIMMPYDMLMSRMNSATLGTQPTDGGALIEKSLRTDMYIDALRAKTVLGQAGAFFMPGLVGNVDIPRLATSASFAWVAEDGSASDTSLGFGVVAMTPKTAVSAVHLTRRLINQATPAAEALIRNDMLLGLALTTDSAGLQGTGASNQPRGVVSTTGVLTQTVATANTPSWAEIVGFESKVDNANALGNNPVYVCTPTVAGNMKTTPKVANAAVFINEEGFVNGYKVLTTTAATKIMFGDFSHVIIGQWGALDVVSDTATKAASGGLVLRVFADMDVAVRYPQAFCINA